MCTAQCWHLFPEALPRDLRGKTVDRGVLAWGLALFRGICEDDGEMDGRNLEAQGKVSGQQ